MQQTQMQVPTPQQPKRKRFSRNMIIGIACVVALIIGGFWIAVGVGWLPSLFGINPTNFAFIASVLVAILGVLFAFIQNLPNDKISEVTPTPVPLNINVNIPSYQPVPVPPSPTPALAPVPEPPPPSLPYRGMAQPPSTNPKTIQQRINAVKEVYEKLTQADISAVVLVGIGGQGKSTLASLVYNYAEQQRKQDKGPFKGETLWLRVEENATFLTVAENIFTALGNRPAGFEQLPSQSQAYALVNALNKLDPPLLIVLDQFENLLNLDTGEALTPETGELLDALNNGSCSSRILLTSRPRPRGIRMTTYDSLVVYPVSDLTIAEGQALLKSRGVTTALEKDLQLAVQRCNGHSLSLCLLASLLDENKLSLSTLLNDPAYKQLWDKNVAEKLLAEIYKRLNDNQRELLHALSIYREAISRDAIQALVSDATKAHLDTLLSTMQAQQLVQVVEGDRRQLHPIVATYVQNYDKQFNKDSTFLDHEKAAKYYLQQAAKMCPSRDKRKHTADVLPLIEAVWQFCQAERWQEAYELMDEEYLFTDVRRWGGNVVLLELGQSLLVGINHFDPSQTSRVYYQLGFVYDDLGQKQEALTYYEQALAIFGQVGDRGGEGVTLWNLGAFYQTEKRFDIALSCFILAKRIFIEVQSPNSESVQEWIDGLHKKIGDQQFAALLQTVEPHAQQIVDDALREVQ